MTQSPNMSRWNLGFILFLCFAAAILGDSTVEAMLLSHFDAALIPRLFLVNAASLFLCSGLLISMVDRVDRGRLFQILLIVHAIMLLCVRLAIQGQLTLVYVPLYSYAYTSKIILFTLFWTLVNDLVDSRSAGKVFPFIAAGGTVGAILVSFSIPFLLNVIQSYDLLIIWSVLVLGAAGALWRFRMANPGISPRATELGHRRKPSLLTIFSDLQIIRAEPLMVNMAFFYLILFVLLLNQQCLFYQQIKAKFITTHDLAVFLGVFNGISMGSTLLLQMTCSGYFLRKIGATRSMFLMPLMLTGVFLILLASYVFNAMHASLSALFVSSILFWPVVLGMGGRIAFFDSFFSPNFQLFFSGLPAGLRGRGKFFLEGIVKPTAMVLASLLIMAASAWMSFGAWISLLSLLGIVLLIQTFRIKSHYTKSLVTYITGNWTDRTGRLAELHQVADNPAFLNMLEMTLKDGDRGIRAFVIELLAELRTEATLPILMEQLESEDRVVRAMVSMALRGIDVSRVKGALLRHLDDPDLRVRANVVESLGPLSGDPQVVEALQRCLQSANNRIRCNAIIALWSPASDEVRVIMRSTLHAMLQSPDDLTCSSALYALSKISDEGSLHALEAFSTNEFGRIIAHPGLLRQFTKACADMASSRTLEILLRFCRLVNRKQRLDIITAVATQLGNGLSVEIALDLALSSDCIGQSVVLQALLRIGWRPEDHQEVLLLSLGMEEIRNAYSDWAALAILDRDGATESVWLLRHALAEGALQVHLENLMSVASILDHSGQIGKIIPRLNHEDPHVRGRALEVLDNAGNPRVNRRLVELLETSDSRIHHKRAISGFGISWLGIPGVIDEYKEHASPWIRECAAFARADSGS